MPRITFQRPLILLAWSNVILHLAALALAAIAMRPGSPLVPLRQRLDYLAGAPLGWTVAWSTWMACTLVLIAFLAVLSGRLGEGEHASLVRLGLMIAIAGAAFDLFCDSVYLLIFPMLAASPAIPESEFLILERVTGIGSLVVANGAYSVAIILFTRALGERKCLMPFATAIGYAVAGFGLLLAAGGFTGVPWHAELATPPTIGLFCVWVVLVGHSLERAQRSK